LPIYRRHKHEIIIKVGTKMQLDDLITASVKKGLEIQSDTGCFPCGHNGPWKDEDTYTRTTAHWALLLYKAYQITDNDDYLFASRKACDYLLSKECIPFDRTFYCRKKISGKNLCNGLIGQAWAVEPLIFIGKEIGHDKYLCAAEKVLLHHHYDYSKHAWSVIEIDGKKLGIDATLNQQIWFSTMALILGSYLKSDQLMETSHDFFENVASIIEFMDEGLIQHTFSIDGGGVKNRLKKLLMRCSLTTDELLHRSVGYLTFVLYGFALAYKYSCDADFWKNERMRNMLLASINYMESKFPYGYLEGKDFLWQYNPVGIEMAFVLETFQDFLSLNISEKNIVKWLSKQFEGYYDFEQWLMIRNTGDPAILSSRLYEAIRLKNYQLDLEVSKQGIKRGK
jgi:hypothetical protein